MNSIKTTFLLFACFLVLVTYAAIGIFDRNAITSIGTDISTISDGIVGILLEIILIIKIAIPLAAIAGIAYAFFFLRSQHHISVHQQRKIVEAGVHGNYLISADGSTIPLPPLTTKAINPPHEKKEEESIKIPTLRQLLESGYLLQLIQVGEMVLGYHIDGSIRNGIWDDIRTCIVAGKSRYGKTVTMFFLAIQAILARATVIVCDAHGKTKVSGLAKMLEPLISYCTLAVTPQTILDASNDFISKLDSRINGDDTTTNPCVLFIDEWTKFALDKTMIKKLGYIVHRINNEGSGYNMFVIVGGQSWKASMCGGNALRDSFHAKIVHHLEESESGLLLARKFAKYTDTLKKGYRYLNDTSGDTEQLITPLGVTQDAAYVAALLGGYTANMVSPETYQQQLSPGEQYDELMFVPFKQLEKPKEQKPSDNGNGNVPPTTPNPDMTPDKPLISTDGKIIVLPYEIQAIITVAARLTTEGKLNPSGKVKRTLMQQELNMFGRNYKKIEMVCDTYNL